MTISPPRGGRGVLSPPEGRLGVQMFLYRMVSPAIVRPLTKIVVPLHCLRKTGRRACICRLQEATRADSRDQHVQTPEAAKTKRSEKLEIKKLKNQMEPLGIHNCNPLNIRRGKTLWKGELTLSPPPWGCLGGGLTCAVLFCRL